MVSGILGTSPLVSMSHLDDRLGAVDSRDASCQQPWCLSSSWLRLQPPALSLTEGMTLRAVDGRPRVWSPPSSRGSRAPGLSVGTHSPHRSNSSEPWGQGEAFAGGSLLTSGRETWAGGCGQRASSRQPPLAPGVCSPYGQGAGKDGVGPLLCAGALDCKTPHQLSLFPTHVLPAASPPWLVSFSGQVKNSLRGEEGTPLLGFSFEL